MRHLKILVLTVLVALVGNLSAFAYDFEANGLYFNVVSLSDLTCEVTSGDENSELYAGDVNIPVNVSYKGRKFTIVAIGKEAFYECSELTSIKMSDNIVKIGDDAFYSCTSLKSLELSKNITVIPYRMCHKCENLETIIIPKNVTKIENWAFGFCTKLEEIIIPSSVANIGTRTFASTGLKKLIIEDSDNEVHLKGTFADYSFDRNRWSYYHSTFDECDKLEYLYLGRNFTIDYKSENNVKYSPFMGVSNLKELVIGSKVTKLPLNTFVKPIVDKKNFDYENFPSLKKLKVCPSENELKLITNTWGSRNYGAIEEDYTIDFKNIDTLCLGRIINKEIVSSSYSLYPNLIYVDVTEGVTEIPQNHFRNCKKMEEIHLPSTLQKIGNNAFGSTDELLSIICHAQTPPAFEGTPGFSNFTCVNGKLLVPKGCVDNYQNAEYWKLFWEISEMDETLAGIEALNKDVKNEDYKVYNIKGMFIRNVQREDEVQNLPQGIYIINGKQTLIK